MLLLLLLAASLVVGRDEADDLSEYFFQVLAALEVANGLQHRQDGTLKHLLLVHAAYLEVFLIVNPDDLALFYLHSLLGLFFVFISHSQVE